MRVPRGHTLRPHERPDPIVWRRPGPAPPPVADALLAAVFRDAPASARLRSWDHRDLGDGRTAYRIACRGGHGMHADPGFPRWQCQLVTRNDGWAVVGLDRALPADPLRPGDLYLLDAHSPHALVRDPRAGSGRWFAAAGLTADESIDPGEARRILEMYLSHARRPA